MYEAWTPSLVQNSGSRQKPGAMSIGMSREPCFVSAMAMRSAKSAVTGPTAHGSVKGIR
jgi:hypothetical protein